MGVFGITAEGGEIGFRAGSDPYARSTTKTLALNAGDWVQQTVVYNSATQTIQRWRINGVDDISNLSATSGMGNLTWARGLQMGDRGTFTFGGRLGEIIVYKDQLSDAEISSLEGYQLAKWNLDP